MGIPPSSQSQKGVKGLKHCFIARHFGNGATWLVGEKTSIKARLSVKGGSNQPLATQADLPPRAAQAEVARCESTGRTRWTGTR